MRRGSGAPRLPEKSDFPLATLSIIPKVTVELAEVRLTHVVILLHEAGGSKESLKKFAWRLQNRRPDCAFVILQGSTLVPGKEKSYHWGDRQDDWNGGFLGASSLILKHVIESGLISVCGFGPRNVVLLGHGQGGMAALATVSACDGIELGGVVTIGGPMPTSIRPPSSAKIKTPFLILRGVHGGHDYSTLQLLRKSFIHVDISTIQDAIPEKPKDLEPLLEFFAHRLGGEEWTKQSILSLDGGGIRGYGSLLILQDLMNKIGEEEKRPKRDDEPAESSFTPCQYKHVDADYRDFHQDPSLPRRTTATESAGAHVVATPVNGLPNSALFLPCHYFTYVAGTSTGGLIAIMISRLRMTVDDCIAEYKTLGAKVFGHPRPFATGSFLWHKYNYRVLEEIIQDVTSRHSEKSEYGKGYPSNEDFCRSIVLAYADQGPSEVPYLFRTYFNPRPRAERNRSHGQQRTLRNFGDPPTLPIWQVARATSAAPNYFPLIAVNTASGGRTKFKDGGFGSNNPSDEAYFDIMYKHGGTPKNIGPFTSIGTGIPALEIFSRKEGNLYNAIANVKAAIKHPTRTLKVHDTILGHSKESDFPYYRFDGGKDLGEIALDEWKSHKFTRLRGKSPTPGGKTLEKLHRATSEYLKDPEVQGDLVECAKLLVRRRRLRTRDLSAWERYASASSYECDSKGCERKPFHTRQLYKEHISAKHNMKINDEGIEVSLLKNRKCWTYSDSAKSTND